MTSISKLPDEPKHSIKFVSAQTGVPAITLRAWERRYAVLNPHRSASNRYRLYSDRDIAILRWLKSRVDIGVAISAAAAELRQMANQGVLPEAVPIGLPPEPGHATVPPARYAQAIYQALIRHEEDSAGTLLQEVTAKYDLKTILMEVITPCLVQIGEAWFRGDISITTEHIASTYLRGKLLTLFQAYPSQRSAPSIMVGGAPTEEHEIGALMMAMLLRSEGYAVDFLGTDIPLDDLLDHAGFEKPAMIILTATTRPAALEMKRMQEKLNSLRKPPVFGYGGFAFNIEPELRKQIPGIYLGERMDQALEKIAQLIGPARGSQPQLKEAAKIRALRRAKLA